MKKILYKVLYKVSWFLMIILNKICIKKAKKDKKSILTIESYNMKPLYGEKTFCDRPISQESYDLSIIIPVYNSEKYIKKCLDSVLNQKTKYAYQVICINDGSTDTSLSILNEYKTKFNNLFIIDQKNGGISVARNNGIRAASGKYLGFIDNDDWVTENYIQTLLDKAYENDADIVKCNHVNYSIPLNEVTGVIRHNDASIDNFELNIMEFKGYIWGGIIKKSIFNKIRFPEGCWYEDIMMRFTLMRICKKFEYIDKNLYYYALHKTNSSKTLWKKDNIKTLDFYYLLNSLCKINKDFNISTDYVFYNQLVYELGPNLWLRTRKLSKKLRETLFVYACDMANEYYDKNNKKFYDSNYYISRALTNKNYYLWCIASFHVICGVHIGYVK